VISSDVSLDSESCDEYQNMAHCEKFPEAMKDSAKKWFSRNPFR